MPGVSARSVSYNLSVHLYEDLTPQKVPAKTSRRFISSGNRLHSRPHPGLPWACLYPHLPRLDTVGWSFEIRSSKSESREKSDARNLNGFNALHFSRDMPEAGKTVRS